MSPHQTEPIKVLLVEDDEDDFILTRGLFSEMHAQRFQLEWVKSFSAGLEAMPRNLHDICLIDYRLGAQNGIELLRAALDRGCQAPIILLTGQGEHQIDLEAMKAGASDYLVKSGLEVALLERTIRYALERKRSATLAAAEQARLAAFGAEVGLALTKRDSLDAILHRCATAMAYYLGGTLARIWVHDAQDKVLKLQASAGVTSGSIPAANPLPKLSLSLNAFKDAKPILINEVNNAAEFPEPDFPRRDGITAYAAYPLILEERLVGGMSIFSRNTLSEATLQEMSSVANGIGLCIERKRSEKALDASEIKYRSVVESIREVIFQTNEAGEWIFLSPAWTDITGFSVKETLGTHISSYLHPDHRERHCEAFQQLMERKQSYCRDEVRYLAKDGSYRWLQVYAQPTLDANVFGTTGTLIDITQRKRAEAEIEKLAAFPQFNPDPVMEISADGSLTYVNEAAKQMVKLLALDKPEFILPPDAADIVQECLRTRESKGRQEICIKGRTFSWSFFPIVASKVVHCYGYDITDRINLETQFRHAQKLESIGQLAAGVAHDFNNILTIIEGHSDRLLTQCEGQSKITGPLSQISAAAKRAASLTRQLLMFSRKQVMQPKVLDLNAVLVNMAAMLHRLLGDDIAFETKYAVGLPAIEADAGMIEQIVMNLAVNSRDAMPRGGQLLITTSSIDTDAVYVRQRPEAREGRFVCLNATDTGSGMDQITLNKIFEPFFTTKEVGKGTGLGLATVYGIVKQHQGWIEVKSQIGSGTTFRIFLPTTDKKPETASEKLSPVEVRGGRETILVVEDEPVLRELARIILQDYEYQVLEAATGREALEVWEKHSGQIDLLLTDMIMPEGMSGRELAEQLTSRNPHLKVIYTSGYSSEIMGRDADRIGHMFLQKPYPPPQLAQFVRQCLDVG